MKRSITIILLLTLIVSLLTPLNFALAARNESIPITYRAIKVTVDGKSVTPLDGDGNKVEPFLYNGTTYLPVRAIGNALGLSAAWNDKTSTVQLSSGADVSLGSGTPLATNTSSTITITYRGIKISIDGKTITPKDGDGNTVEPFIYNGTTYLPVRAIATALDLDVTWIDKTSTVALGDVPTTSQPPKPSDNPGSDPAKLSKNSDGSIKIDYSNADKGIVSISAKLAGNPKTAVIITTPAGSQYKYFYTHTDGSYDDFLLPDGSGSYQATVYKNLSGTSYTSLHSHSFKANITDSLAPFLRPNFYVDYDSSTKCISTAATLCAGITGELKKVEAVYYYVVNNYKYDYDKASSVESGYRPDLDNMFSVKKGICFDYASMMVAMLRSQGVPSKMIHGYIKDGSYHAWINVYTAEAGWVEAVIYFNGQSWKLMDPTFASSGGSNKSTLEYINNPDNYTTSYVY